MRVRVCARLISSGGGGGVPSLSTIMRNARMAEPLYSSGLVCILVLITSMGVV